MPIRLPIVTDPAARVLLDGLVDYAGLFPPAALSMPEAVKEFARSRGGDAGWILGRFVCPATKLDEFAAVAEPFLPRDAGAIPWRISAIGSGAHDSDMAAIVAVNKNCSWSREDCSAMVDTVETKANTLEDVDLIDRSFPSEMMVYIEVPNNEDPIPFAKSIAQTGRRAKIRTGGVVADAFPSADTVVRFMDACVSNNVPFKATAGLHHVVRGSYNLTYAPDSESAPMYGFLNVFLTAAFRYAGLDTDEMKRLLLESNAAAFSFDEDGVSWNGNRVNRIQLAQLRENGAISFGSCSFSEPVSELRALKFI